MKDELQGKLVEILTSIQSATGAASDFAMTQLPDIAQSYILYGRVTSAVGMVLGAAAVYGVYRLWRWSYALTKKSRPYENDAVIFGSCFGGALVGIAGAATFLVCLHGALLVWFAPKVWLLKELAAMVR